MYFFLYPMNPSTFQEDLEILLAGPKKAQAAPRAGAGSQAGEASGDL